jgi:Protein of unknown function (DUF2796)
MLRLYLYACLTAVSLNATTMAAGPRQLGAHEHGAGTLNIAIEGTVVTMELEVPGDDIVGFEHAAVTGKDKAALARASAVLNRPLDVFRLPAAAQCTVKDAKVAFEADDHEATKPDTNDTSAKPGAAAKPHNHAGEAHRVFHATYVLECAALQGINGIDFEYFKTFSRAQKLTVNVITSKAQTSFEVSRKKARIDLSGVM